jgi:hypothetical protein
MKIILEFEKDKLKVFSDDDPDNIYLMGWNEGYDLYSLWYNQRFLGEEKFDNLGSAVGSFMNYLLKAMAENGFLP